MLTDEQETVVACDANNLVVNAYAGAGKTSTLVEYAKRRPEQKFLYVAFNKAIKEDAAKKFPKNVRCATTHALAFPTHGRKYQGKLGTPRASQVVRALELDILTAGKALAVVNHFLTTACPEIDESHVDAVLPKGKAGHVGTLVDYARQVWAAMCDTSSLAVSQSHDGYLKLFSRSNPVIPGIDRIMFDEAQDANAVTLDFIRNQPCAKIFVGDSFQSIYSFRGAVNALSSIDADERLFLTSSFRFGEGIATLATALLTDWGGATKPILGNGRHPSVFRVDTQAPHAVISRTNAHLFQEAVRLLSSQTPFGFSGGVSGYRFDQILDAYFLSAGQKGQIRDQFLGSFASFSEMVLYGETLGDKEVKALCSAVETYGRDIPQLVDDIKERAVPQLSGQEVVLTTTHKSKGLEWLDVVLTDDFAELQEEVNEKGERTPPDPEEINILYVAMTRAQRGRGVPPKVVEWLHRRGTPNLVDLGGAVPTATATTEAQAVRSASPPSSDVSPQSWAAPSAHMRDLHAQLTTTQQLVRADASKCAPEIARYLHEVANRFASIAAGERAQ